MSFKAHLLGFVDTTQVPPVVVAARVSPDGPGDLCCDQVRAFPFEIHSAIGGDYAQASALLELVIREHDEFAWVRPLLTKDVTIQ